MSATVPVPVPVPVPSPAHPFIKALDNIASKISTPAYQYGENSHVEYRYVDKSMATLQEQIIQFSFQLVRTSSVTGLSSVAKETREILNIIMTGIKTIDKHSDDYKRCIDMGVTMFKLLAQTRDIISGKGEYMLFYVMLLEWAKIDFRFFEYVIETLVYENGVGVGVGVDSTDTADGVDIGEGKSKQHPLGSWKDMKYFLTYMKEHLGDGEASDASSGGICDENRQLYSKCVNKIVNLINEQLRIDAVKFENGGTSFSLVARWVPREKSKRFGWLYYYLAMNYSQHQIPSDTSHPSYERAVNRAFMIYRKVISAINKKLDTTQIKQCNGQWAEINFDNVTSITMHKQTNSFLNLSKNGKTTRCDNNEDRDDCKYNYETYLRDVVDGTKKIKGKRVSIIDFVRSAIDCKTKGLTCDSSIVTALNEQWKSNSTQNDDLGNFVAMADVSGSMTEDNSNPLHSAIGLSIRVAEKSALGQRVMTFSERPTWIQLGTQDSDTFVKQVNKVLTSSWGMTTNFYLAIDLIRQGIEDNKLPREVSENLVLVVFSDMQMNNSSTSIRDLSARATLFENIKQMFAKMGERLYGEPCKAPHIVFWNLRKTTGFPSLSTDENVSMMSGFSPALLNVFCEKGVDGLQQYKPWNTLQDSLNNKRYNGFEPVFKQVVGF
jgi:hypothetical protein